MNKVLILGAGFVSRPIVQYLLDQPGVNVTVAARRVEKAKELLEGCDKKRGKAVALDLENDEDLKKIVKKHDVIVSLLPYTYHVKFAELCIEMKKHLVTTSYVSDAMRALDEKAKEAGVILLNEIGLDPGIDHMSAMKMFNHIRSQGGQLTGFESYCGGLPAPEAVDNPFGYKFSWSPKGVLKAGKNDAQYEKDGNVIQIEGRDLFNHFWKMEVDGVEMPLEGYPNRDSMPYIKLYGLEGVRTMFRGTLRFRGWCSILKKIADLGMLDENVDKRFSGLTYKKLMGELIGNKKAKDIKTAVAEYIHLDPQAHEINAMDWLGLFSDEKVPADVPAAPIDILTDLMNRKMAYNPGERDMVALHHIFTAEYPCCIKRFTSTLVDFGIPNGDSSMARTVSLPCAVGVHMILEGKITKPGVHIPVDPDIYNPVLDVLETMGIKFVETEQIVHNKQCECSAQAYVL